MGGENRDMARNPPLPPTLPYVTLDNINAKLVFLRENNSLKEKLLFILRTYLIVCFCIDEVRRKKLNFHHV